MSMRSDKTGRKQYTAPTLKTVALNTKEVLAVGCKNTDGISPVSEAPPCWANSCQSSGS